MVFHPYILQIYQMKKVEYLKDQREKHGFKYLIQVDGGINEHTIGNVKDTGVDIVVSGTYITKNKEIGRAHV